MHIYIINTLFLYLLLWIMYWIYIFGCSYTPLILNVLLQKKTWGSGKSILLFNRLFFKAFESINSPAGFDGNMTKHYLKYGCRFLTSTLLEELRIRLKKDGHHLNFAGPHNGKQEFQWPSRIEELTSFKSSSSSWWTNAQNDNIKNYQT